MARLPTPGADAGQWGAILNEYLSVAHSGDGTIKSGHITSGMLKDGAVTLAKLSAAPSLAGQVLSSDGTGLVWVDAAEANDVPVATTTTRGIVRLAGDLTGDSLAPLIAPGKVTGGGGGSIASGTITNANIHASANIAKSKLEPLAIVNDDIAVGAAITQSKIQNLVSDLAGKAAVVHSHAISDITGLQDALDDKASGTHNHSTTDITSGTFAIGRIPTGTTSSTVALGDHTHDDRYYTESEIDSALADKLDSSEKGVSNGIATLGSDGKVPTSQLPSLAINDVFTAANEAAMLALDAQRGDVAIRTDIDATYILSTDDPSTLEDWKELISQNAVSSVAGKTGAVTLTKSDVGLGNVDNTADMDKPVSTAVTSALAGKANTSHAHAIEDVTGLETALDDKADATHDHDDRYYTESEVDDALAGKSDTGHTHDSRYYTESEVDAALADKADAAHTHDDRYFTEAEVTSALSGKLDTTEKGAVSGLATLDSTGKVPANQLPALAINEVFTVADETAMLALDAQRGDIAIRTDLNQTFILATDDPSELTDWKELISQNAVTSVAGKTGAVSLNKADVGLGNVDNTADMDKPVSTAVTSALAGKADSVHTHDDRYYTESEIDAILVDKADAEHVHAAGDITSGTLAIGRIPTGTTSSTVALGDHNHDSDYAALDHNHDADYAAIGHDHDTDYAALSHTHDDRYFTEAEVTSALADKLDANLAGVANGIATLGSDGKVSPEQLPAVSLNDIFTVEDETAMLALDAQRGDMAIRTDTSQTFILAEDDPSVLENWIELASQNAVSSVAGKTGAVTLTKSDVGLGNVDNTSDMNKPVSTAVSSALAGKADTDHDHAIEDVTGLQTALDDKADADHNHDSDYAAISHDHDSDYAALSHTHDDRYYTESEIDSALADKADASLIGATSGIASLDSTGKVPATQLPALAINEVFTVEDEESMLALDAQRGDIAIRTDLNQTFILATDDPSELTDWKELISQNAVTSVAGKTGAVSLNKADVGLGNVDNTADMDKPVSTAVSSALAGKANTSHAHAIEDVTGLETALDDKADADHNHDADYAALGHDHDSDYAALSHTHDDRYYTESEIDSALAGKSDTSHTHDDRYYTESEVDAALADKADASLIGATNGIATLGSDGKVPTTQLPALAINEVFTVEDEESMLELDAQRGDVAIRSDINQSFILSTDDPSELTDWKELVAQNAVSSVAGKTGAVTLNKSDVGLGNVDNTSDMDKPVSTAVSSALAGKADTSHSHNDLYYTEAEVDAALADKADSTHVHAAGDITSGTLAIGRIPTGTTSSTVALGNHDHDSDYAAISHEHSATDITSGSLDISVIPTGTSGTTVALGDHTHAEYAEVDHDHNDLYYTETEIDLALADKLDADQKGVSNGVATLGSDGKIPATQLPALAIKEVYTVASQVAMLALDAQRGDMAIRTDIGRTFVLASDDATTLSDWKEITAQDAVTSVAGKTGVVTLDKDDVGLGNVDNTSDMDKPVSTAVASALADKADTDHAHAIEDVTDLQTELDGKADTDHDHAIEDVTGLQTALDGKAASAHTHAAANVTSGTFDIARIPTGTTSTTVALGDHNHDATYAAISHDHDDLYYTETEVDAALEDKADADHDHAIEDVTGLQTALDGKAATTHNHDATYAAISHTHTTASITSGTFDIARIPTGTSGTTVALGNHDHGSDYAAIDHDHDSDYAPLSHTHNDLYYTEGEVDAALADKADAAHTHDDRYFTEAEVTSALSGKLDSSEKGAVSGLATLDSTGKVPTTQLPALAINEVFTVADETAMLALDAQRGDVAIRTDTNQTFILSTDDPAELEDWKELIAQNAVTSVAGKTGAVSLNKSDVGLGNVDNTSDMDKPVSTAVSAALADKADADHDHDADYAAISHTHDDRYYTESEVDSALAGKADIGHNHDAAYAAISHDHDDLYYTETEVDAALEDKADADHDHAIEDVTGLQTALDGKAATTHNHDAAYAALSHNHDATYAAISHNHAAGNITSGTLDIARIPTGTTSSTVSLGDHNHDSRYYTETEVDAALDTKVEGVNGLVGIWHGTQAEYDLIETKDPNTLYAIVEE